MTERSPIPWTTAEILEATGGELLCGDLKRPFANVSIDSRAIAAADVFFAIVGDVHDGHGFADNVVAQGTRGIVINRNRAATLPLADWGKIGAAVIAVEDTTRALGDLAAFNRRRTQVAVVAITGSNGKTTTRQLTTAVLAGQFKTLSAIGNFNNAIGLPLTLLRLESAHQWAVVELGTNNPGEIARLAEICAPDIGVITNIGPAHLEGLGSLEGVMREKGDLLRYIRKGGKAVLNADDPRVLQLARHTKSEVLLFGFSKAATIRAEGVEQKNDRISFTLIVSQKRVPVDLNTPGQFMVLNALAASAVGYLLGLSPAAIKSGLENFVPASGRMSVVHTPAGIHIIDDTYNANPDSMEAAIATLQRKRMTARGILVVGDMLELGVQSETLHRKIGAVAARSGVCTLCTSGKFAGAVAAGARAEGMRPEDMITGTHAEVIAQLKARLQPGDWVLVKGSRGMAMEKVVEGLKAWASGKGS